MFGVNIAFDDTKPGAIIMGIVFESLAQKMEFNVGDTLLSINRVLLNSPTDFDKVQLSSSKIEVVYQLAIDGKLHRKTAVVVQEIRVVNNNNIPTFLVSNLTDEM